MRFPIKKIFNHIWAIFTVVILPMVAIYAIGWILQLQRHRMLTFDVESVNSLFTPASLCCMIFGITIAYMMGYRVDRPIKLRGTTPFSITILFTVISVLGIVLFFPVGVENYAHLFEIITSNFISIFVTNYLPKALFCVYLGLVFYKTVECWYFYLKERKEVISKSEK